MSAPLPTWSSSSSSGTRSLRSCRSGIAIGARGPNSIQGQLQTVRVGQCPGCKRVVTASDQFIMRRCPWSGCEDRLQQVLPLATAGEFPPAIAGLVGALGGFLFGVAASQGGEADDAPA